MNKPVEPIGLHKDTHYLRDHWLPRVYPVNVGEVLGEATWAMESPVSGSALGVTKDDALELNELVVLEVLSQIGVLHIEFVPRHVVQRQSAVHDVGKLGVRKTYKRPDRRWHGIGKGRRRPIVFSAMTVMKGLLSARTRSACLTAKV